MKTKSFIHKLLAVGALMALGLGFATGVQALVIDDFNTDTPHFCRALPSDSDITCPAPVDGVNIVMDSKPGWDRTLSAELDAGDSLEAVVCDNCQAGHHDAGSGGAKGTTDFTYTLDPVEGSPIDLSQAKRLHFDYAADQDDGVVKITFSDGVSSVVVTSNDDPNFPAGLPNTNNDDDITKPANRTPVEIPMPSDQASRDILDGVVSVKVEIIGVINLQLTIDDVELDINGHDGHYVCYKSFGHFLREEVNLEDQFDDVNFKVLKPKMFCNPAMKPIRDPDQGIENTEAHLLSYKIKKAHREPRHVRKTVLMQDQFGVLEVQTIKPDRLMVPSGKSLDGTTVPADPNNAINHYKCYKVRTVGDFQQIAVNVADQFTDPDLDLSHPLADDVNPVGKDLVLVRPTRMCTPVSKNGEGIIVDPDADPDNPLDHLMCYSVKAGLGSRLNKRTEVLSNNQFRDEDLVLKRELELCAPASKTVLD